MTSFQLLLLMDASMSSSICHYCLRLACSLLKMKKKKRAALFLLFSWHEWWHPSAAAYSSLMCVFTLPSNGHTIGSHYISKNTTWSWQLTLGSQLVVFTGLLYWESVSIWLAGRCLIAGHESEDSMSTLAGRRGMRPKMMMPFDAQPPQRKCIILNQGPDPFSFS